MGCPVLQGYGLTETCACATLMQLGDHSTGRVGPPVTGINIRYSVQVLKGLFNILKSRVVLKQIRIPKRLFFGSVRLTVSND